MPVQTCANTYPLTLVQEDIWLSQMIHNSVPLFNIGGNVKINGFIDADAFIETHRLVTEQNDAFRMVFHKGCVLPRFSFSDTARKIELKDFSGHGNPDKAAMQWWTEEFCRPFQIHDAQMSRYYLLKTSTESYYYAVCAHHLTMDGYCFAILNQRLLENYNYLVTGTGQTGNKPSYADFTANDQGYRESDEFARAKAFWTQKFETIPRPMIPRRYTAGFKHTATPSAFSHIWLTPDVYYQLIRYSKEREGNVFFLMAAILYTYFLRTTDIKTFVFSLPLLNRPTLEFMDTMGPFVNVVPVCLDFGLNMDIQTFFKRLKDVLKESFPHQRFPLGEINRAAKLKKSGRTQLFDVSLSYEKFNYDVMDYNGTKFEINTMHNGWDQTPLTLAIKEYQKKTGVKLEFYYNLAAYKPAEIDFLMERIRYMLEQVIDTPDIPLSRLNILPEKESRKLLVEFNRKAGTAAPPFKNICEIFRDAAKARLDHTAVQFSSRTGRQKMTYQMLNDRSDRLSSYLRSQFDGPAPLVAFYGYRSIEMVIGILSILKAGGAYVPLDPDYPEERIKFMLEDSKAQIILTQKILKSRLAGKATQTIIPIDDFPYDNIDIAPQDTAITADSLAYVIYTSGTTGQPKGVMCTHGGLSNLAVSQNNIFSITPESRVLQFASLCFDASVSEIFTTLTAGATLVLASKDDLMPGPPLLDTLQKERISHVTLPPSSLAVMDSLPLKDLSTLITAGEPCPSKLFEKWGARRRFINAYGPTEATVCASAHVCKAHDTDQLPMGEPIDNVSLYVLDDALEPVPAGVPGQLYIGGAGVAKGYLNQPKLTREKFIINPFDHADGHDRLYRTGDMVRFLADATLMFMGRFDHQVKVRGYRIEPEEVEKVIASHPKISEAAVIARKTSSSDNTLVLFFSGRDNGGAHALAAEIRQFAKQKLPDYMIPSRFIPMDAMPHTPSGKLDRRILEKIQPRELSCQSQGASPATETHQKLSALLAKAMNIGTISIGRHDDFFEAGMDSLSAVRFISLLEKAFNQRLLFSDLMASSTIHTLAKRLTPHGPSAGLADRRMLVPISNGGAKPPFFCITAGYGDVVKMQQLSRHLGKEQPFFMLQPDDISTRAKATQLAQGYMDQILSRVPNGPYRLGGYSAGGLMAYETARLLTEQGSTVELLAMIGAPRSYSRMTRLVNQNIRHLVLALLPGSEQKISSNMLEILRAVFLDAGLQYHLETLTGYRPQAYKGKIDYFQGKWAMSRFLGTHRTWMKNAKGPFELHMLPGNHDSFMKEPHVASLALRLKQCINAVDQKKGMIQ